MRSHVERQHTFDRTREFICAFCSSRFYDKVNLDAHIRNHVKENMFSCRQCNFQTYNPSNLANHVKSFHRGMLIFTCSYPECNLSTSFKWTLSKHLKGHDPDPLVQRPFPCFFADWQYRASTRRKLHNHIEVRHNPNRVKNFSCPFCPKTFYTKPGVD